MHNAGPIQLTLQYMDKQLSRGIRLFTQKRIKKVRNSLIECTNASNIIT